LVVKLPVRWFGSQILVNFADRPAKDIFEVQWRGRALSFVSTFSIPWLHPKCQVLFHTPQIKALGKPLLNALARGKPVIAGESDLSDAVDGPGAYLAALDQPRQLCAALLTVIVEDEQASRLSAAPI